MKFREFFVKFREVSWFFVKFREISWIFREFFVKWLTFQYFEDTERSKIQRIICVATRDQSTWNQKMQKIISRIFLLILQFTDCGSVTVLLIWKWFHVKNNYHSGFHFTRKSGTIFCSPFWPPLDLLLPHLSNNVFILSTPFWLTLTPFSPILTHLCPTLTHWNTLNIFNHFIFPFWPILTHFKVNYKTNFVRH